MIGGNRIQTGLKSAQVLYTYRGKSTHHVVFVPAKGLVLGRFKLETAFANRLAVAGPRSIVVGAYRSLCRSPTRPGRRRPWRRLWYYLRLAALEARGRRSRRDWVMWCQRLTGGLSGGVLASRRFMQRNVCELLSGLAKCLQAVASHGTFFDEPNFWRHASGREGSKRGAVGERDGPPSTPKYVIQALS